MKIADFGLARIYGFTKVLTSVVVTLWYRSPEVLLHSPYTSSVDMWSVGCIFAELYMKRPLFIGQSDIDQLYKIFEILGVPEEHEWPVNSVIPLKSFINNSKLNKPRVPLDQLIPSMDEQALDLLKRFLDFDLNTRITARDALAHAYFQQLELQANQPDPVEPSIDKENTDASAQFDSNLKLPDISNLFQPNILKRKRLNNATNLRSSNAQ